VELKAGETLLINGHSYRLEWKLDASTGSYGKIWAATDVENQQPVALKFIHTENQALAGETAGQQWQQHLQREIEFLSRLTEAQTAHIVKLLNHGEVDGQPVLVLERLQTNLQQWAHQQIKPLPPRQVVDWACQIVAGLAIIHAHGLIYRDLKFSNVLVSADGQRLKLADFGTVKAQRDDASQFSYAGTPSMMAPEQRLPVRIEDGKPVYKVDHRADFYALGLMLFRLLTEQPSIASQEKIEDALRKSGYEGVLQEGQPLGGLNAMEEKQLHDAIWASWGLNEATAGPSQNERFQQAHALYELIVQLLAPRKEERPNAVAAIATVLNAVLRVAPATASTPTPPVPVSPPTPPLTPNPDAVVPLSAAPTPPVAQPPMPDPRPIPLPRRPWVSRLLGLAVGVLLLAGALNTWWQPVKPPPGNTTPPLPDEPLVQKTEETPGPSSSPVPVPEPVPEPVPAAPEVVAAVQPTPTEAPPAESPAPVTPAPPAAPVTAPTLTPVPPPVTVTPPPIAVVPPKPRPLDTAPPSVVSSATEPTAVAPAIAPPVPPSGGAPEPVANAETPTTHKPTAQPTPSQSSAQRQPPVESATPAATVWQRLERDPLTVGGVAPELAVVPAGALELTAPTGQKKRVPMPAFALAAQPVTRADYAVFARHTGRSLPYASSSALEADAAQPITAITWQEVQAYVQWLSHQTGQRYRLPRESEWLYSQKHSRESGRDSAWTGFEWTDGCEFGDYRPHHQMAWSQGKREPRPIDQGGRDVSFRVVRDGSGR